MSTDAPTYGSLFSGAGGFDIGMDAAGFECKWQVEIDHQARGVLNYRWPNVKKHRDVCEVGAKNYVRVIGGLEPVDVLIGGFPCQNLSVAGAREGLKGSQSGLWWEMLRIISELQPKYAMFENVPGLLSSIDEEYDSERCLCGWDFGWGGLLGDRDQQEDDVIRCEDLRRDDTEGHRHTENAPSRVRRNSKKGSRGNGEMGGVLAVAGEREAGRSSSRKGNASPRAKEASGPAVGGFRGNESGECPSERLFSMESGNEGKSSSNAADGDGSKQERTGDSRGAAFSRISVCPGCGRDVSATEEPRLIRRNSMGTVVRSMLHYGYVGSWRILDARWFGVPQRRRRIFALFTRNVVGGIGKRGCGQILALPESLRRDPQTSREAGQDVAGTLGGGAAGRGWNDDTDRAGAFIPVRRGPDEPGSVPAVAGTLNANGKAAGSATQQDAESVLAFTIHGTDGTTSVATETDIASSLRARAPGTVENSTTTVAMGAVAFNCKEHGGDATDELSPTLRAMGHDKSHANGGGQIAIAYSDEPEVFQTRISRCGSGQPSKVAHALSASGVTTHSDSTPHVFGGGYGVRRLTPTETERLMGWPDGQTRYGITDDGKKVENADGPRYRMTGNGVVSPLVAWLAVRLRKRLEVLS